MGKTETTTQPLNKKDVSTGSVPIEKKSSLSFQAKRGPQPEGEPQEPPRPQEAPSPDAVREFMRVIGEQDNVNLSEESVVRPGAVFVGDDYASWADSHTADAPEVVLNERQQTRVVAHLAPDDDDVDHIVAEEMEAQVRYQVEERVNEIPEALVVIPEVTNEPMWGFNKRNTRMIYILMFVIVLGGMSGLVYWKLRDKPAEKYANSKNQTHSESPKTDDEGGISSSPSPVVPGDTLMEELRDFIAPTEYDLLLFDDRTSPQSKALEWLQNDPITLMPGRPTQTVLERYVLAVLYYSTSGPSWAEQLLSSGEDICTWNYETERNTTFGILCKDDEGVVDSLALWKNNLRGTIPWEIVLLSDLRSLNVRENTLTGSIPSQISDLTRLEYFNFGINSLTGVLPTTWPPHMRGLHLRTNSFLGSIPSTWETMMPALKALDISETGLTGTVPTTLGKFENLTYLDLSLNSLTGTIPTTLGRLTALTSLHIIVTSLTGTIPTTLGLLTNLSTLEISYNSLSGTIPATLLRLTNLVSLFLNTNGLSGTIPSAFEQLVSLTYLDLSINDLTGTIPTTLGQLTNLEVFHLVANKLTGTIPTELGQISSLSLFSFFENMLYGSVHEIFCGSTGVIPALEADCEEVDCPCCTYCCQF